MVEYSRTIGRLLIVWRLVLLIFIAIDIFHPSEIYSAGPKYTLSVFGTRSLISTEAALGLLALWTVLASVLEATWSGNARPFVLATVDTAVAIAIVYTQRTLLGPMLFSLPVLALFATNVLGGGAAAITMIVIFSSLTMVKSGARPEGLAQSTALWFVPFTVLAAQFGFVYHAMLRQEVQARALISVIETSQELASASLEKILQLVTDDVKSLFDCSTVVVYLKDNENPNEPVVRVASRVSLAESFTDFNPDMIHSIIGQVMKEKKGRFIDDFETYQPEEAIKKNPSLRAVMVAPLLFEDDVLGVVFVASHIAGYYNDQLFRLFALLSNQVALAVRNVQLHKTTETLAITDSLSGLFTHGYFQEHLGKEVVNAKYASQSLSLMIIDVDFFKKVNDTYGHPQGDALLKQLGSVIKQVTRPTDVVCRYGGDEFTVTMLSTNRISAVVIAERIRQSVEDYEFVLGNQIVHITVSGGVASFPEDAQTKKELIEKTDKAMYESKHKGRNRVSFSA